MDIGAVFEVAVAETAENMDWYKVRTVDALGAVDPNLSATEPLADRVQDLLWDDDDPDRAVTASRLMVEAAELLAELTLAELDARRAPAATDQKCPWGVSDIVPLFAPKYSAHWSHTGGGCYAIEIPAVEGGTAGDGSPYILITGEDVYTADDYDHIGGDAPHFFNVGLYDHPANGTVGGETPAHFWAVIGAHNLPRAVDALFQLATIPGGGSPWIP